MKIFVSTALLGVLGAGFFLVRYIQGPTPVGVELTGSLPPTQALVPTPRKAFTPTRENGRWNIDVVDDFYLPAGKTLTFSGAGRNLHVQQDWAKLFRRGFSSIDKTRMVPEEYRDQWNPKPPEWKSRLKLSQRALTIGQGYLTESFKIGWGGNSELAKDAWFRRPSGDPQSRNSLHQAMAELEGSCENFGDCPPGRRMATYGKIFLDFENEGTSVLNRQEHANLYVYMMKTLKEHVSPATEVGSIGPWPLNTFGYSRARDFSAAADWLWTTPARLTASSRARGMPEDIVGKSFADYTDFQMPGVYYLYGELAYDLPHNGDGDRHWLASLLHEQEVNMRLSPKKRIAWHWLFNTTSSGLPEAWHKTYTLPPAIAEGTGLFYWFTGAYGAVLWDDASELAPGRFGVERNYSSYEYYLHGLWRVFKHHGDLFNGKEKYLNDGTECSFDGGKTWYKYNANQLKTRSLPYARAIVNGNQILIAATKPYAQPGQTTKMMVRYLDGGYQFYTTITLKGDEIFLGRATLRKG